MKKNHMPDLTRTEGTEKSVGAQLETLIQNLHKMNLEQMKIELTKILDDPNTHVSKHKSMEYKNNMSKIRNVSYMQSFITNIYLAAANLSTKDFYSKK